MSTAGGPPVASAPAKKQGRFSELDALRGMAAVAIVGLHAYQDSRGLHGAAYQHNAILQRLITNLDFGLGVFFALSGFVVFLPFARAIIDGRSHMGVKEFMIRRAFRLLPLYFIVIFLVWNARYYGGPRQLADLVRHLTFTQIYSNDRIFFTVGPSWSLAVEMHYYIGTAILVFILTRVARRVRSRRNRIILVAAFPVVLALASVAYKAWAFYIAGYALDNSAGPKFYTIYYSALARGDGFAFGMLLAVIYVAIGKWRPSGPALPRMFAAVALIPFAYMVSVRSGLPNDPNFVELFYYSWIGLATTLLMAAMVISKPDWPTMRFLRNKPLQFTGTVSYSLYLWHEPLMLALEKHHLLVFKDVPGTWPLSTLALITVGLCVAWVSYHIIEVPGQRLRYLLQIHRTRTGPTTWRSGELRVRRGTDLAALPPLRDEDGAVIDLGSVAAGRPLVAFLHPGRYTPGVRPGCVAEARAFRESAFLFEALGVRVVGVSAQPPEAQKAFREREDLPFAMLSDEEGRFTAAAGVPLWRDDSGGVFPERVTLVIDRFGTIQDVLGAEIPPAARPGMAAARTEPLLAPA